LEFQIVWRAEVLKRLRISPECEPPQMYLDRKGKPITLEMVNAKLAWACKKKRIGTLVTLESIKRAVIAEWLEELKANNRGDFIQMQLQHYVENVLLGRPRQVQQSDPSVN
jgi:hypothetical protein